VRLRVVYDFCDVSSARLIGALGFVMIIAPEPTSDSLELPY
jgi:hypothetical protein